MFQGFTRPAPKITCHCEKTSGIVVPGLRTVTNLYNYILWYFSSSVILTCEIIYVYIYFVLTRCIKAALLPNPVMSWVTEPSKDIRNPRFSEKFRIVIPKHVLLTKTLQVNIWCLLDNRQEEIYVSTRLPFLQDFTLSLIDTQFDSPFHFLLYILSV